jgi:uncharacterized protein YcbX
MTRSPTLPSLVQITLYPVKSLDGLAVTEVVVLPSGALEHDRRFAVVDDEGRFVNGKRTAKVHLIRSTFDATTRTLTLSIQGRDDCRSFSLDSDRKSLNEWLSDHFDLSVTVVENAECGFPDDTDSPGPTLLSTATLRAVSEWFPELDEDDCRRRFRANLEVGGVAAFWEDRLFTEPGGVVRFRVGEVVFEGVNPCQRCVVPSRSPMNGEPIPEFQKRFSTKRRETLPPWAAFSRFNHFYRLAINTRIAQDHRGTIRVGDEVEILESEQADPIVGV